MCLVYRVPALIQNLRSALDHLSYDLFVKETKGRLPGRHIYFPIEKDAGTYAKEKGRKILGIATRDQNLIDSTKPYKGGNDILWRISELNNIDKHRLLITVGSSFGSVDIGTLMMKQMKKLSPDLPLPSMSLFIKPADNLFPLKKGDELFTDSPNAEPDADMQFRFEILLNEKRIVDGEILTESLQAMINEVEKLIPVFNS